MIALLEQMRAALDADILSAPVDTAYGLREIRVRDPHGYILAFGKMLETR